MSYPSKEWCCKCQKFVPYASKLDVDVYRFAVFCPVCGSVLRCGRRVLVLDACRYVVRYATGDDYIAGGGWDLPGDTVEDVLVP